MSETNASIASRCHTLLIKSLPLHKLLWLSNIPLQASRRYLRRCRPHRSCHHISAALLGLTLVALAARLHGIGADNRVVWDETHFGRFATRYIKREFYLDVHPPLGKLLLMLVYSVFGYSGDFDFESGSKYPSTVPIAASRYVQALLGALLAPVSVLILQTMLLPSCFAWIAGIFVAMDNALIGISRIVVLDSMLLLTNALALYAFLCFRQTQVKQLQNALALGIALGVLCSIKLVGLLTLAVFNVILISDILIYSSTAREYMQAFLCLLSTTALPLLIYLAVFWIQFIAFQNYTPEADHMGSEFVARLNNSAITLQYPTIHSGSFIVLRSAEYPFEYLSAYAANNSSDYLLATRRRLAVEDYWKVQGSDDNSSFDKSQSIEFGDHISLLIPKTPFHISILNQDGLVGLDKNDDAENVRKDILSKTLASSDLSKKWHIVVADKYKENEQRLLPIISKFRLRAEKLGCELAIDYRRPLYDEEYLVDKSVPQQYQFRCVNQGRGALWNIEHHLSSASETPISLLQHISTGYSKNIFTYNRLMHELNGMLVSDPDQLSLVESHPLGWPFLFSPMPMVQWSDTEATKYMLVGNPALWWSSALICIWIHPLLQVLSFLIYRRSHGKLARIELLSSSSNLLWILWVIHYFPFFMLSRATYLHHYLPAFYFALLLLAVYVWKLFVFLSHISLTRNVTARKKQFIIFAYILTIASLVLAGYIFVYPLTYGTSEPCRYWRYRLLRSWKICRSF